MASTTGEGGGHMMILVGLNVAVSLAFLCPHIQFIVVELKKAKQRRAVMQAMKEEILEYMDGI
jgi:hypothetical protein